MMVEEAFRTASWRGLASGMDSKPDFSRDAPFAAAAFTAAQRELEAVVEARRENNAALEEARRVEARHAEEVTRLHSRDADISKEVYRVTGAVVRGESPREDLEQYLTDREDVYGQLRAVRLVHEAALSVVAPLRAEEDRLRVAEEGARERLAFARFEDASGRLATRTQEIIPELVSSLAPLVESFDDALAELAPYLGGRVAAAVSPRRWNGGELVARAIHNVLMPTKGDRYDPRGS